MKVNTNELLRQSEQFLNAMNRMLEIRDTVQKIDRNLSRERTGAQFHASLNAATAQIERQARDLRSLQKALEQIAEAYSSCETRIVDRTEHLVPHDLIFGFRVIDIPNLGPDGILQRIDENMSFDAVGSAAENSTASAIDWTPWDPVAGGNG